jgi:L-xylulokinase
VLENFVRYLLGIDIGLTKIKATAFSAEGEECFEVSSDTSCIQDGALSEKNMNDLWDNCAGLLRRVSAEIDSSAIIGVGVSGHGNGLYLLDKEDHPFINAVLSTDTRAQDIVDEWNHNGISAKVVQYTVQYLWAGQPLPVLEWFKRNRPEIIEKTGTVLFCKDYINNRLTGSRTTDYSDISAAGAFDNVNRCSAPGLFEICGLPNLFPPVIKATDPAGRVNAAAAAKTGLCEGTIVAGGSFDAAASAIGAGALGTGLDGYYSITAGTWSINAAFVDHCVTDGNILQCNLSGDGTAWFAVESSPTSAVNLDWFIRQTGLRSYRECDEIVEQYSSADCEGIYLPYVYPMPRYPDIKGGFYGTFKDNNEKLRILYEGIAFGHRFHLEKLQDAGIYRNKVRLSGGLAASSVWRQILADVLNLPVELCGIKNPGAFGAALCAGAAASVYPFPESGSFVKRTVKTYSPRDSYEAKYKRFMEIITRKAEMTREK